jgi:hypothetical protein
LVERADRRQAIRAGLHGILFGLQRPEIRALNLTGVLARTRDRIVELHGGICFGQGLTRNPRA